MATQNKERVKRIIKRHQDLQQNKGTFGSHWEDLSRVLLPRRAGFTSNVTEGDQRMTEVYDSTGMREARDLANAKGSFERPDNEDWVKMVVEDDSLNNLDEVKDWLWDARRRFLNALYAPRARFRQANGEIDLDEVVFGTAIGFVGETMDMTNLFFRSIHLKDGTPMFSDEGVAEGMFIQKRMPIVHLMQKFGEENLSENTRKKIREKKIDEEVDVLQTVLRRNEGARLRDPIISSRLPWEHLWIEVDENHTIEESGFHEFPFFVPRWDTSSGETYGRSPGMIALPDTNTLQAMGETLLVSGQRNADPPLAVPNDGFFNEMNTFPGGIVYYEPESAAAVGGNPFFSLDTGANMPITRDMQLDYRQQVTNAFFKNVFNLPIDGPQMTATEVIQRKEEFVRVMGPIFGRSQTDRNAPMIERAFMVMLRAGGFPDIPEVLAGANIRFEFESPATKIREQVQAAADREWVREILELSQVDPDMQDLVDLDAYGRKQAIAHSISRDIVRNQSDVEQLRQEREEARQQIEMQQQAAMEAQLAEQGSKAAKNISQAVPQDGAAVPA